MMQICSKWQENPGTSGDMLESSDISDAGFISSADTNSIEPFGRPGSQNDSPGRKSQAGAGDSTRADGGADSRRGPRFAIFVDTARWICEFLI